MTQLWWARRDLRLDDNPALLEAQAPGPAAAVFAWTPAIEVWSGRRRAHLARALGALKESAGGALVVRRRAAPDVILAAAQQCDAHEVWAAHEYTPSGIREQAEVAAALESDGRQLCMIGSPYAVAPGRVTKSDRTPYRVFTPFRAAWRDHGWRSPAALAAPAGFTRLKKADAPGSEVDLDQAARRGDAEDPLTSPHPYREADVREALEDFVDQDLTRYAELRDRPDLDATSQLSSALNFGLIHPRTVLALTGTVDHPSARTFESELAWREFHADTLWHEPQARRESLTTVVREQDWAAGAAADAAFAAWRDGTTGFPLVDAGMRQLAVTGWMHNRVRMVVASFLVKDLHLPWQRGADHFRRTLVDYDHAQNQLNWQWVAGTGRDASPYFRVFNPHTQARKFDPKGTYVARWVPEHGTTQYPEPMVDHQAERETALALNRLATGRDRE